MLLATRHKRTLTPASMGGTRFTYPEGWKAELTRWLDYPGRESNPRLPRPLGRKSDALAAVPPGQERPMRIKPSCLHHCHLTTNSATNSAAAGCSLTSSSNISTSMEHIDRVNRAVCWTCDNLTKNFFTNGCAHATVLCPSVVCPSNVCILAKRCALPKNCLKKQIGNEWPIGNRMVTWLITSRDPERSSSWPQYA